MRTCEIETCEKPHHTKGWCGMHYQRFLRTGDPEKVERLYLASLKERLEYRTLYELHKPELGECWVYDGAVIHFDRGDGDNYRGIRVGDRMLAAHQASYQEFVGSISSENEVHHLCGTKACWRPNHLQKVTNAEHYEIHHPERPTHCPRQHEYTPENTYVYPGENGKRPKRYCKECRRYSGERYRARKLRTQQ